VTPSAAAEPTTPPELACPPAVPGPELPPLLPELSPLPPGLPPPWPELLPVPAPPLPPEPPRSPKPPLEGDDLLHAANPRLRAVRAKRSHARTRAEGPSSHELMGLSSINSTTQIAKHLYSLIQVPAVHRGRTLACSVGVSTAQEAISFRSKGQTIYSSVHIY
jgi:hypothetical protein